VTTSRELMLLVPTGALTALYLWRIAAAVVGAAASRPPAAAPTRSGRERARAVVEAAWTAGRHPLGLAVAALLLVDVRLLYLAADPPVDLGPSGGAWTDPGEYAHNARNRVLFGQWVWDEVNFMYVSPLANLGFYAVFRLLGVGYAQAGLVSVLFSLATLPLFYLSLAPAFGRSGALLATLLLGGNHLYITYNRIGLVETPAVFFLVLTLYFGQRGARDPRWFAAAGTASVLPLAVKMQMAYIVPAALLSVLLWSVCPRDGGRGKDGVARPLAWFLAGAGGGLAVLAALWIVPYRDQIAWRLTNEWRLHALPLAPPDLLQNVYFNPFVGYFWSFGSRVLLLVSGVYFFRLLVRLLRGDPVSFPEIFALWWFVGGFSYLAISQYRPLRYYVSLVPAMTILAASALIELWRARAPARVPSPWAVWVHAAGLVGVALTAIQVGHARLAALQRTALPLVFYPLTERQLAILAAALALALSALTFRLLGPRLPALAERVPPVALRGLAAALVTAFLVTQAWSYLDWVLHRDYKLVSVSRQLGATLPPGSVIAGIYAPILALENRHRALAIWNRYGNWEGDPLGRFGVTHVVVMDYIDEIGYYHRRFPEAMARARLLDSWSLWKTRVSLYELPPRAAPAPG
jgi:4-amino-4-deoxy-L-arabinose transferase-like glycosyltransferase